MVTRPMSSSRASQMGVVEMVCPDRVTVGTAHESKRFFTMEVSTQST
jgi:hypothetical protein